jgi:glycine/D-amino acid oxidase-like deaminating enzyme
VKHTAHGYWLEEAGEVAAMPALEGERSADVVVIGGGYTGMWTAWQLKRLEPDVGVVLLEADVCGHGPSGRNGGFCNSMWFSLANMRERWGDGPALAVARAARDAIDGVGEFCRDEGVDAWFRRGGYLQVSTAPAHDGTWDETVAACRELGVGRVAGRERSAIGEGGDTGAGAASGGVDHPVQPLSREQVAERCASPAFRGGAYFPDAATVQPARLALGLRERLLAAGVEIYERSPVGRLAGVSDFFHTGVWSKSETRAGAGPVNGSDGGVIARTDRGTVRAGAAVVAIGGAAKAPRGPLRNSLTVTSSHIVLTEPVPELLEQIGWTGGECITDSRALIDYFRTTPDGRIAFGWGGGRIAMGARLRGRGEIDREAIAAAAERLYAYFPVLADADSGSSCLGAGVGGGRCGPARITHAWGGPIDVSPTHIPIVVPLRGGRSFAAAGYTGNGVGPSYMVGRSLASLALDRRDDHSRLPFVDPSPQRVPPEPFHWLGGEAIRRALTSREDAELSGRRPHPVSSLVSKVPELIGFHIGR